MDYRFCSGRNESLLYKQVEAGILYISYCDSDERILRLIRSSVFSTMMVTKAGKNDEDTDCLLYMA